MVEGYSSEEVVDWCLDYIDPSNPISISKSRHEGRLAGIGILGEKTFTPDMNSYRQAHFLVLQHAVEVSPYMNSPDGEQQQPGATCRVRKARTSTKWPVDKMVVTEIDEVGPTERRHILRLRKLAGLIARQRLSLVMPKFNSLTKADKWRLFDQYVTPFLEFPAQMKTARFKQVMKRTTKSWRTHKSNLVCNYITKMTGTI